MKDKRVKEVISVLKKLGFGNQQKKNIKSDFEIFIQERQRDISKLKKYEAKKDSKLTEKEWNYVWNYKVQFSSEVLLIQIVIAGNHPLPML